MTNKSKTELKFKITIVSHDDNGNEVNTPWEDIPKKRQDEIREIITDKYMKALGYVPVEQA